MKNIPVLTVSNRRPEEHYYCFDQYHDSLARFEHSAIILGNGRPYTGMMSRLKLPLACMKTMDDKHVIITDSWDLMFLRSPVAIIDRFLYFGTPIVFSAERTLFPAKDYGAYPEGKTDSRYLNAGFIVGEREALIELFEHMDVDAKPDDYQNPDGTWHHESEQEYLHHAFVEQFIPMTLDYESVLCQSMFETKPGEIDLSGDRIRNTITNSEPMAIHWNGPAKTTAPVSPAGGVAWWRKHR